jgi:hypothetical protein
MAGVKTQDLINQEGLWGSNDKLSWDRIDSAITYHNLGVTFTIKKDSTPYRYYWCHLIWPEED